MTGPTPPATRDHNTLAIAVLRVAVGVLFLIVAEYKVFGSGFTSGGFENWIHRFIQDGAYPFMQPILQGFVLRHARGIAYLVAYGELAIGLSLVLGFLVREASLAGLIYMLTLLFAANYPGAHAAFWQYFGAALEHLVLALCFVAFLVGEPQQRLSVVRWFRKGSPGGEAGS